jgi:hypothetical protein
MAGAALEAAANEVVQDILDGSTSLRPTKPQEILLTDLLKERGGDAISRYRTLALLVGIVPDLGGKAVARGPAVNPASKCVYAFQTGLGRR